MFDNNYINISNIFKAIDIQQATLFGHVDSLTWLPAFKEEPTFGAILTGMRIAFGFGAIHALAPGHGKALVSAYLDGLFLVCGLSLGLASVLITLGLIAGYAKQWLEKLPLSGVFVQRLPIFSAAMVVCIGIGLTVLSLV